MRTRHFGRTKGVSGLPRKREPREPTEAEGADLEGEKKVGVSNFLNFRYPRGGNLEEVELQVAVVRTFFFFSILLRRKTNKVDV